ncbi:MAG: enoyl-CoA hydratase, partial [Acidobacteria bacterium]|nr:enoyl-CoA hydratase [Acidobacteriota bacterium]
EGTDVLPRMVAAGLTGRKGGRGFYRYSQPGRHYRKRVNSEVRRFVLSASRRNITPDEIQDRLVGLMVNEAAHCLGEGIIGSPLDGDMGAVLGLGFPPFFGGPFHYVDTIGAALLVDRLARLAQRHGPRFEPAPLLCELAATKGKLYRDNA